MEPKEFWEDKDWIVKHYAELQEKYRDKWVAVIGGEVVSYGEECGEVRKQAFKLTGKKYIPLIFVEGGATIY
ncbi:MAG: DUF5678 domain-containing protein [Candidatus Jordarchaeaceae archaeon]